MGKVIEKEPKPEGVRVSQMPRVEQQPGMLRQDQTRDEAMAAFEGLDEEVEVDKATDLRLLRKIDLILMPVSVLFCSMNFAGDC